MFGQVLVGDLRERGGGKVLHLLANPSFFSSHLSLLFSSLFKIRAGEAGPQRHVTAREPNG